MGEKHGRKEGERADDEEDGWNYHEGPYGVEPERRLWAVCQGH